MLALESRCLPEVLEGVPILNTQQGWGCSWITQWIKKFKLGNSKLNSCFRVFLAKTWNIRGDEQDGCFCQSAKGQNLILFVKTVMLCHSPQCCHCLLEWIVSNCSFKVVGEKRFQSVVSSVVFCLQKKRHLLIFNFI